MPYNSDLMQNMKKDNATRETPVSPKTEKEIPPAPVVPEPALPTEFIKPEHTKPKPTLPTESIEPVPVKPVQETASNALLKSILKQLADVADSVQTVDEKLSALAQDKPKPESKPAEKTTDYQTILDKLDRNDRQMTQCLRENANFQFQVRQGMQHDLDALNKQVEGQHYIPLLKAIAQIYSEYMFLLDDESLSDRARGGMQAVFDQLEETMLDYNVEIQRTAVGEVRPVRTCTIIKKLPTGDPTLHNTIAASIKPGVLLGKFILAREIVDVYVYDESLSHKEKSETSETEEKTEDVSPEQVQPEKDEMDSAQAADTPAEPDASEENKGV